jgi:hypothetical protein
MAPRIHLSLRLAPITNVFFEGNTSHSSFSESSESSFSELSEVAASRFARIDLTNNSYSQYVSRMAVFPRTTVSRMAVFPRTTVPAALLTREYWTSFFQFTNRLREIGMQPGATTFRTTDRLSEQLTKIFQSQRVLRSSKTTDRPLLTIVSSAVHKFTHSLKSNLIERILARQEITNARDRRETATEKMFREWSGTTLSLTRVLKSAVESHTNTAGSSEWTKLNETVTASTHSFLALLHNSNFSGGFVSPAQLIPDVSRQFTVSRSSGPDAMARQIQYFGAPPNLSYVKRESPQLQQLVSTLKEARTAPTQVRTPAPEFPSVAQLTTHVRQELERELRIERERRGL